MKTYYPNTKASLTIDWLFFYLHLNLLDRCWSAFCIIHLKAFHMNAKTAALIIGISFIVVGLLGFVSNPIVGDGALFHTDTIHNMVHIISGALFLLVAFAFPASLKGFMKLFGIVYFALGFLGFIMYGSSGMGLVLGFLHVNGADNYLHLALGLVIFLAGTITTSSATRHAV